MKVLGDQQSTSVQEQQISDYHPFHSKASALLFILTNSPKPLVRVKALIIIKTRIFIIIIITSYRVKTL